MTDELTSYRGIGKEFEGGHHNVRHSHGEYSRSPVHVNNCESFFGILKRGVYGTFHHVSKEHLDRYCDEFSFRWNHRKESDTERMKSALSQIDGRRLIYETIN